MLRSVRPAKTMLMLMFALTAHSDLVTSDSVPAQITEDISGALGTINSPAKLTETPCPQAPAKPGCSNLIESFCTDLYSQKNQGNLDLRLPGRVQQLRFGDTPNGRSYSFAIFEKAKFDNRAKLPQDLQRVLNQTRYFEKMQEYLQSKPIKKMNLLERKKFDRLSMEIGQLWNSAVDEVMLERMESKHPGYSKLIQFPLQFQFEYNKEQSELYASVYTAIWSDHPLWKQVESDFETVKSEYITMLEESESLDPSLKKEWIDRIQTTKLVAPGSDPNNINHDCATTDRNAYNVTSRGYVTVCAGYFTAGNMIATLAHELSHSLGVSRSQILFERNSELGKRLHAIHQSICNNNGKPQCPKDWPSLKNDLQRLIDGLKLPELPKAEFLSCLQYHKISRQPPADFISTQAKSITASEVGRLSDRDLFLKLTEKQLPLADGSVHPNPRYLNPCSGGFLDLKYWQLSGSWNLEFLFTEEFLCSGPAVSDAERMKKAIDSSRQMQQQIEEKLFAFGGPFSNREEMTSAGFAEDSEERFADSMGYRIFARILKKIPSMEQRRSLYYAANAKFCGKPSLQEKFSEKAQIEKEYSLEPHSSGKKRRNEVLIAPIRSALDCAKDFNEKECSL